MVHAFLVHSLRGRAGDEGAPCRVLYARVFAPGAPQEARGQDREKERLRRREQVLVVARQVESMCRLSREAAGRPLSEHLPQPPEEPPSPQEAPAGVFRLAAGDPFPEDKAVLWLGVQRLAFVLVCDPHENLVLAEGTLRLLARALLEHLKPPGAASELLLKADRAEAALAKFLPHGQLLFLNDQFVLGLERELSASLCK